MLIPTLREKRHYLALEILSKSKLTLSEAKQALEEAVISFLGSQEAAKAGLRVLELKEASKHDLYALKGIASVNRKYDKKAKASLALLSEINGKKSSCNVKGVSGTIKRLREKFLS